MLFLVLLQFVTFFAILVVGGEFSYVRQLLNNEVSLLIISAISLIVSILVMIVSSRAIVKPISAAIKTINTSREYGQALYFQPSNIYEFDMMTDAITQLQINVQEFSSQVSQMIRIADVGLGIFMYDRTDDSVYVGQSFLKIMRLQMWREEDIVMSREDFLKNIIVEETRQAIDESLKMNPDETQDYVKEYSVADKDGGTVWMRLRLVYNKSKSIGVLQNITGVVMEK